MDIGLLLLSFLLLKNSSTGLSINKLVNYLIILRQVLIYSINWLQSKQFSCLRLPSVKTVTQVSSMPGLCLAFVLALYLETEWPP